MHRDDGGQNAGKTARASSKAARARPRHLGAFQIQNQQGKGDSRVQVPETAGEGGTGDDREHHDVGEERRECARHHQRDA